MICIETFFIFVKELNERQAVMKKALTQKQLGQRLVDLRKMKGLSQEEVAKLIGISRPSLAQIELGNRSIDILEMRRLSVVLKFSLDDFMSDDFQTKKEIESEKKEKIYAERISVPDFKLDKFKNVLLYILERCAGKPNVGETVLYKLLYFSDFNYYELYEEQLTGATYRKLQYGPVPQNLDSIIHQMMENKELQRIKSEYFGFPQTRYIPMVKSDLTQFNANAKEVIDKVIGQMSDWSAAGISEFSHKDIPWLVSKEGEVINYELVFYRDSQHSVRNYEEEIEEQ